VAADHRRHLSFAWLCYAQRKKAGGPNLWVGRLRTVFDRAERLMTFGRVATTAERRVVGQGMGA
jgi:hypothetical protein